MSDLHRNLLWLPPAPAEFDGQCRGVLAEPGNVGERLAALAGYALDENRLIRLARIQAKARAEARSLAPLSPYKLGVVANGTIDFVSSAISGTSPRFGLSVETVTGAFDQALQDSTDPESKINAARPTAVLVALDWRGMPIRARRDGGVNQSVDAALSYVEQIREGIRQHCGAICIVQNLAAPAERVFGSYDSTTADTVVGAIGAINDELARSLRESSDVLFDVAGLASTVGVANWFSPQQWNMAKLPFAQEYVPLYADHVCRLIASLTGKSRRCLVLDLDNTMWGGVIGDDGLAGIQLAQGDAVGEAFLELQRYALSLRDRGVVLAVSSKNDDAVARRVFREHPEMLVREEHVAVFQANWNDKPTNIAAIAEELSLGLSSFVFVDDNPFERELVRKSLPAVAVPEMPSDPALYARTLSAAGYFELARPSEEDLNRARFYEGNARRATLQKQVANLDEYLASLDMEIVFRPFDDVGRARISQLINKSNQYNLTTRRYSESDVETIANDADAFTLQVRLIDNLGDNGMISVVICRPADATTWEIDTWLMSCRVLGRRVEHMVLREIAHHARQRGVERLLGVFIPTSRNGLVEDHYAKLGFELVAREDDGTTRWALALDGAELTSAPMRVRRVGFELEGAAQS